MRKGGKKSDVVMDPHEFRINIRNAEPRKLNEIENPYDWDCVHLLQYNH